MSSLFARRPRTPFAALLALVLAFRVPAALGAQGSAEPQTPAAVSRLSYYGVYLRDAKVGSFVLKQTETTRDNVPAVRVDATLSFDMRMLGAPARIVNATTAWSDKNGKPLALEYTSEAAGRVTRVFAAYGARSVSYKADIMGTSKSETLPLGTGENFLADATSGKIKPQPGLRLTGKVFSPETLTLLDSETTVVGQEAVAIGGQSVSAYKVLAKDSLATSTLWLTEEGELLRLDSVPGIQIRREPKDRALAEPGAGQKVDLAAAMGILPTGAALEEPRALRYAQYEITGLTRRLPLKNDNVQTTTQEDGGSSVLRARVVVTTAPLPAGPTVPRFKQDQAVPEPLRPYLKSTVYVPSGDPQFRELARTVVGSETDAARAAARIAGWVHKTMIPDPGIAVLRTARDIAATPRGVCRDYTTLFTAIARAAGIPTKQCVGVAYAGGRFLYHAWPEVWVGNDTWVALEPTWGASFADATHVKLAEGEITDVFALAQDFGNYRIKVLSAR